MSEEQGPGGNSTGSRVQVNDRRRFTPDGEPIHRDGEPEARDATAAGPGAEAPPPEIADPRDTRLAEQQAEIDRLKYSYAALVEESKAARARLEREKVRVLDADRAQLAQALLDGVDHLERALAAAGDASGPLVDGVRLTLGVLAKKVQELGASRVVVVGQRFDPRIAEAIDTIPVSDPDQDELVLQEIQAGYRIGDRVLRPARVRVGRLARG